MFKLLLILFLYVHICTVKAVAQDADSTLDALQHIPTRYINTIDSKIDKYSSRVTNKTEKTLIKLSKWENKIKYLLQKVNPQAAEQLFGNNQLTFSLLLQKIQEGKDIALQYHSQYDQYRDNLTTNLKYLQVQKENINQKLMQPLQTINKKINALNEQEDKSEAIQKFILERKKQLIDGAYKHIGRSKYLSKINKEAWYYAETLKNYKVLFNDPKKAEETVKVILNNIPAAQMFIRQNSMLASLFGTPQNYGNVASLAGLQTRSSVQSLVQSRIAAGGAGAMQQVQQNIQAAHGELRKIKNKLLNNLPGAGSGGGNLPDFKPNMQKTKTLKQRLEFGSNFQYSKSNSLMPTMADIGVSVGFKINDKSVAGIGASYKLGIGTIDNIHFSTQGMSVRTFTDWKLKKQFFMSGGIEMNYLSDLPTNTRLVKLKNGWQQSALLGISKKIRVKTKWFKETKLQLLYDFLAKQHVPTGQSMVFRVGYNF